MFKTLLTLETLEEGMLREASELCRGVLNARPAWAACFVRAGVMIEQPGRSLQGMAQHKAQSPNTHTCTHTSMHMLTHMQTCALACAR